MGPAVGPESIHLRNSAIHLKIDHLEPKPLRAWNILC